MNICILGWYGTETIGDRAIFTGLVSFFSKSFKNFSIKLGSIYPFYSERMINEDASLYSLNPIPPHHVSLFDSTNISELKEAIKWADLIAMGGGPLMDLIHLHLVDFAFKYAQRIKKETALLGCGIGPLFNNKYQRVVLSIVNHSSLVILRDSISKSVLLSISQYHKTDIAPKIYTSLDPAIECALQYRGHNTFSLNKIIAINFRQFPLGYLPDKNRTIDVDAPFTEFLQNISAQFSDYQILLTPMHYFIVGDDDRYFLNHIAHKAECQNVDVQNIPLSLKETMDIFAMSALNIGMRFHAVVLQTILNGKNYILDYTEPKKGKISGFINEIDDCDVLSSRYINLQAETNYGLNISEEPTPFEPSIEKIIKHLDVYPCLLSDLCN